jgi:uncharacterized protein (TIGR03437 family)
MPMPADGSIPAGPTVKPRLPIPSTRLFAVDIKYAGDAPHAIEGIQQINLQIPAGGLNTPQSYPIQIRAGPSSTVLSKRIDCFVLLRRG